MAISPPFGCCWACVWQKHLPGRLQKLRIKAKVSERDEYVNFSERIERAELLCFGPSLTTPLNKKMRRTKPATVSNFIASKNSIR